MGTSFTMDRVGKVNNWKQNTHLRQFAKFCIVGVMSTAIDWGVHAILYKGFYESLAVPLRDWVAQMLPALAAHPDFDGAFTIFKAVSFAIATLNGFFWNRRWTFRIKGKEKRNTQLVKFYIVNVIGLLINTVVASQIHKPHGDTMNYLMALAVATFVAMFWNFSGHKFWTFRQPKNKEEQNVVA